MARPVPELTNDSGTGKSFGRHSPVRESSPWGVKARLFGSGLYALR